MLTTARPEDRRAIFGRLRTMSLRRAVMTLRRRRPREGDRSSPANLPISGLSDRLGRRLPARPKALHTGL